MKIILMDDIPTLGRRGEVHDVSDGYARNFLLPQKMALHATPANMKNLAQIKASQDAQAAKLKSDAESQAQAIGALHFAQRRAQCERAAGGHRVHGVENEIGQHFTQRRQASDEGRLFGSVGRADLAAFLAQHGIELERRRIGLDEPIKSLGEFSVPVRLHADVTAQLKVSVSRE